MYVDGWICSCRVRTWLTCRTLCCWVITVLACCIALKALVIVEVISWNALCACISVIKIANFTMFSPTLNAFIITIESIPRIASQAKSSFIILTCFTKPFTLDTCISVFNHGIPIHTSVTILDSSWGLTGFTSFLTEIIISIIAGNFYWVIKLTFRIAFSLKDKKSIISYALYTNLLFLNP